jgi:nicotinamidase-related amidase
MKAIVVIDMQNDFVYGPLGSPEAQAIVPIMVEKLREFKKEGARVFFTQDTHDKDYLTTQEGKNLPVPHCIVGTDGWLVIPEIWDELNETNARGFDKITFGSTALANAIQEEFNDNFITDVLCNDIIYGDTDDDEIIVMGVCTDICVVSNALLLKAYNPEIRITVDASCCAGTTPENHKAALQTMKSCQINVINE